MLKDVTDGYKRNLCVAYNKYCKHYQIEWKMPKYQWRQIATLGAQAKYLENLAFPRVAASIRIFLEKFNETKIIRIKGKNVDNLDLERLGNLIQQANEKSSTFNFRRLFKSFKRSRPSNSQGQ